MKQTLVFCFVTLAVGGLNHSLCAQSHLEVGAQTLVQRFVGNSNTTTGPWSPGLQIQGIRSSNGFRYGLNVASVQMAYSETTYRWGQLGLVAGVEKSMGPVSFRLDFVGHGRLAPLQTMGTAASGWTPSPVRAVDAAIRPSLALVVGGTDNGSLVAVVGLEQGFLTVDPSDASVGVQQRVQGLFLGLNINL
jgi:hypothetical protein